MTIFAQVPGLAHYTGGGVPFPVMQANFEYVTVAGGGGESVRAAEEGGELLGCVVCQGIETFRLLGEDGMGDNRAGINQASVASKLAYDEIKVSNGMRRLLRSVRPKDAVDEVREGADNKFKLLPCIGNSRCVMRYVNRSAEVLVPAMQDVLGRVCAKNEKFRLLKVAPYAKMRNKRGGELMPGGLFVIQADQGNVRYNEHCVVDEEVLLRGQQSDDEEELLALGEPGDDGVPLGEGLGGRGQGLQGPLRESCEFMCMCECMYV
jgi:hypothetical protein